MATKPSIRLIGGDKRKARPALPSGCVGRTEMSEVEIGFKRVDILFKGGTSGGGDGAGGAGPFARHAFFDGDVSGRGKFIELDAQVSGCLFGFLFEVYKISFLDIHENGHYGKPELRVQKRIQFFHFSFHLKPSY